MARSAQHTYALHVDGALIERNELAGALDAIRLALRAERLDAVLLNPRCVMLLDAQAQERALPLNPAADLIYRKVRPRDPPVRGNVVLDWVDNFEAGVLPVAT